MFCSHRQNDWADLLPMAELTYNYHHHPSIDMTPFFENYGYHPTLTNVPSAAQQNEPDERIQQIHDTQAECKRAIEKSQEISERAYDKWKGENPGFKVGESVLQPLRDGWHRVLTHLLIQSQTVPSYLY